MVVPFHRNNALVLPKFNVLSVCAGAVDDHNFQSISLQISWNDNIGFRNFGQSYLVISGNLK